MRPLLYLELRQFINSVKNTARSPRRLIPTLLVAAWLISSVIGNILLFSGAGPGVGPGMSRVYGTQITPEAVETIEAAAFLLLSLGSMVVLYQAFTSGMLVFSVAHIDFLFPTPISRRKVLLTKLIKDYLKYGFWVTLLYVIIGSPALAAHNIPLLPDGLVSIAGLTALLLLVVNVAHTVNIVFTFSYERLKQQSLLLKALLLIAVVSGVVAGIYHYSNTGDGIGSLLWAADSPIIRTVFAPAEWCASLLVVPIIGWTSEDLTRLGLLWLLAGASFLLLLSRKENVYEPSIGISIKYARRRQAMRSGDYSDVRAENLRERGTSRRRGFTIPPFGRGATALIWKNLVSKYRMSSAPLAVIVLLPLALILVRHFVKHPAVLTALPGMLIYIVYILSIVAAAETRAELKYSNTVKSMPLAPWKITLAQAVYSALYLGAGTGAFAAGMYFLLPETRGPLLLLSAVTAPFIGFACVGAAMIAGLLYPDTRDAAQNYIYNLVGFLLISLAMVPTLVIGGVLWWVVQAPYYVNLVALCVMNLILGAAGTSIAGAILRRFDPTSE